MDPDSSTEDLAVKARKPYTITKQRERWTEEDHNRFLEALKLYGRAWQRIEEHIGTKTAVQIRSHAQKFFSKLEKEALVKGVPITQAVDIEIPPPRPKRKPSNPYPRKTCGSDSAPQVGTKDAKLLTSFATLHCRQVPNLEKEPPPERPDDDEEPASTKENQDDSCSEVLTFIQDGRCSSMTSVYRNSIPTTVKLRNTCSFREFVPTQNEDNGMSKGSQQENFNLSHEKLAQGEKRGNSSVALPTDDQMDVTQHYPRHVPVHVVDGSLGTCSQTAPKNKPFGDLIFQSVGEVHSKCPNNEPKLSNHQSFPAFHPAVPTMQQNQEDYRSRFQISSTFSNLIVSALLQNPAAHAAASYATTFCPYANMETSTDSPAPVGFSSSQMGSAPSMSAIAAATVAAATAWWASHGLLPLCAPAFTCGPTPSTAVQSLETGQAPVAKTDVKENTVQNPPQLVPEHSEAIQAQRSASKTPTMLSSDSEESGGGNLDMGSKAEREKATDETEANDSNITKSKKQVDRSSCGSNTASSSEVETDALEKHEKGKEEQLKEADANNSAAEFDNPRGNRISSNINDPWKAVCDRSNRISSNINDSWKAVSEEGRIAFQALFSREILPQSFSPSQLKNNGQQQSNTQGQQNTENKDGDASFLDLNCNTWNSSSNEGIVKIPLPNPKNFEEGLLTIGLGHGHGKLKAHRTGFKPYKRCAMEAKENRVSNTSGQPEENCPKRIRLEGQAST